MIILNDHIVKMAMFLPQNKTSCVTLCKESEQLCQVCEDNYYSFDNGKTCEYVEPPKATSTNASWYIRSNLAIISWILLVILA